jgi:outer membrane protein TolC
MNKHLLKILTVFFVFVFTVYSQEKKTLSVDDCVVIGLEKNKTIGISKSKIDFSNAKVREVNTQLLPSLKLNASYTRLSPVDPFSIMGFTVSPSVLNNYTSKLTLMQPLFTGSRLTGNLEMMEYNALASEKDYSKDKTQLVYDIRNAYWNLYRTMEIKKVIDANIDQIKIHLSDIENLFKHGLTTNNEVLKVKVQLSNSELLKIDAENNIQLTMMALNNLLGLPINTEIEPKTIAEVKSTDLPDLKTLVKKALDSRSEIKGMEYRIKSTESAIKLTKSGWYPQISFMANYYYSRPNQRIFPTKDEFKGTWDLGLNLSFDIWNWKLTSYQTQQSQANLEQTKLTLGQIQDGVVLEVNQSYLTASKNKEKIRISDETVKQAAENMRVTYEKFKSGLVLNSDVIDAEVSLLQANINYTTSLVDYILSLTKLEKAIESNIK